MLKHLFFFVMFLFLPLLALAEGSVDYGTDVAPLLKVRPDLLKALGEIEFDQPGYGNRISHKVCPPLAGKRVGSYVFEARERKSGRRIEVRFVSYLKFLDANGKTVAEVFGGEWTGEESLERATSVAEEIVAVGITPRNE